MKLTKEEKEVIKEYNILMRPFIYIKGLLREEGLMGNKK